MERAQSDPVAFAVGLDLGQASDYTALVVDQFVAMPNEAPTAMDALGILTPPRGVPSVHEHHFRHIQRFPLKTAYPSIVASVGLIIERLKPMGHVRLVIDHTGVGRPVVDMFREAGYRVAIIAVTITSGQKAHQDPDRPTDWTVPKKDLVGVLQAQFHQERIKIARGLPEAMMLLEELQGFRMKMTTAANLTFEAWRDGDHDDLVLASALAVWGAERLAMRGGLA